MLLDFLLIILMGVCIVYCWVLNRRIQDLQNSRIEFARMVKELNVSIVKASASVTELNELSKVTNSELKSSIDTANNVLQELLIINEIGHNVANKLTNSATTLQNNNTYSYAKASAVASGSEYGNDDLNILQSRFTDDDFSNELGAQANDDITETEIKSNGKKNYSNQLKKLLNNIVTQKAITQKTTDGLNLNQLNYYDSLRRISTKK